MTDYDFVVKYDPLQWPGWEPDDETVRDSWPVPGRADRDGEGNREPVVDPLLRRGRLLIWQSIRPTADRRRLTAVGRVRSRPYWNDEPTYWVGETGETTVHPPGWWFEVEVQHAVAEQDAPGVPERDRLRLAHPDRVRPRGLSARCNVVPVPPGVAERLARLVLRVDPFGRTAEERDAQNAILRAVREAVAR